MKNKVWLVHGFNVSDPKKSIGKLKPVLHEAGFENVEMFDYGWVGPLRVQARNRKVVSELLKVVTPHDVLVGHSNGCWISLQVCELQNNTPKNLLFINPALYPHHAFPEHIKSAFVLHSRGDLAVKAGKWWRRSANTMPWNWGSNRGHMWGEMGRVGYLGKSKKVKNIELPHGFGHSGVFGDDNWMLKVCTELKEKMIANKTAILSKNVESNDKDQD